MIFQTQEPCDLANAKRKSPQPLCVTPGCIVGHDDAAGRHQAATWPHLHQTFAFVLLVAPGKLATNYGVPKSESGCFARWRDVQYTTLAQIHRRSPLHFSIQLGAPTSYSVCKLCEQGLISSNTYRQQCTVPNEMRAATIRASQIAAAAARSVLVPFSAHSSALGLHLQVPDSATRTPYCSVVLQNFYLVYMTTSSGIKIRVVQS